MSARLAPSLVALALTVIGLGFASPEARAGNHPPRGGYVPPPADYGPPPVRYETVVCYETRRVPYTVCETRYDDCGRPYHVEVTRYRTVRTQVTKRVPVGY